MQGPIQDATGKDSDNAHKGSSSEESELQRCGHVRRTQSPEGHFSTVFQAKMTYATIG